MPRQFTSILYTYLNMSQVSEEALAEFISECEEITQRVSAGLSRLEKNDFDQNLINEIYRDMHTLKGTSQLFGFSWIGRVAHVVEASLIPLRKTLCKINDGFVEALFLALDLIEEMVKEVRSTASDQSFSEKVNQLLPKLVEESSRNFGGEVEFKKDLLLADQNVAEDLEKLKNLLQKDTMKPSNISSEDQSKPPAQAPEDVVRSSSDGGGLLSAVQEAQSSVEERPEKAPSSESAAQAVDTSIRVQVGLLDRLMDIVGELVLVRNQVLQYANKNEDYEFVNLSQSLDIVTGDLQDGVMKTRMQPIGNVLSKFQRVVRNLAKEMGKKIDLTLEGVETELDRTLLEAVKDPLTHIIRNSCDHGIETPKERSQAGKPEVGHVFIRAYHEGGQVVVEVSDDGKGLDTEKIKKKALDNKIITHEKADQMTDKEIYALIFAPGFSTAEKVSSVSGRGVGMDVVRTNIEKIGGAVDLDATKGKGTSIRLKIPLTLAIVPAMTIRCGDQRFAIPQVKLLELIRIEEGNESEEGASKLEYLQGQPMYRLRGDLLPVIHLREVLNLPDDSTKADDGVSNIVVLNADGKYFGLTVDEILDTADIVVKPVSQFLKAVSIFSGATVMGDGSVALILDVGGVSEKIKLVAERNDSDEVAVQSSEDESAYYKEMQEFLVFNVNASNKYAIPLCLVNRLEEFKKSDVEYSGEQRVVRYRGSILPITSLNEYLEFDDDNGQDIKDSMDAESISVIVVQKSGRNFGIEVNSILDVLSVDDPVDDSLRDRPGILGNIALGNELVVVVDVLEILDHEIQRLGRKGETGGAGAGLTDFASESSLKQQRKLKVLFAEDVSFFRKHVSKVLTKAGHSITLAENGQEALDIATKSKGGTFDLILSDIEMPKMDGYELAKNIRSNEETSKIPLIALTTRFSDAAIEKGKQAGFDLYLEKLNPEKLLNSIDEVMSKYEEMNQ